MLMQLESNIVPMPHDHKSSYRSVLGALSPNQGAEMLRYGWSKPGILSLGQGEGSLKTPDFITDAAASAMADGKTFYAPVLGVPEFRQEIANYYSRVYGLNLPTNRIFATTSGTTAMHLALTAVLDEGDEVVAVTPIWKNLLGAIELAQAKTVQVPLENPDGQGWTLDLDKLFDAVTHKTKVILIVTPSNPTGWIMPKEQIKAVQDFARLRGIWIIADEVYGRIVYDGTHAPSFLETAEEGDRLFTVNSFSKSYAMTGWRLGWLVGPSCAEEKIRDIALYDNMGPPTFAQYGGIAALRHGEDFIAQQLGIWRANRDMVMERFAAIPRIKMPLPQSTFYGFFTVDGEPDCLKLARHLIDEAGLSLAPGCAFGKTCAGYLRLVFAVSPDRMSEALDRLERGIG